MTEETMNEVTELIQDQIAHSDGSLDYQQIAEAIAPNLTPEQQHHYLLHGLRKAIAQRIADLRPPATHAEGSTRSARWDQVGEARDLLEDWWVPFNNRPGKRLLDCSATDLLEAVEWYEKRAAGYAARAEAFTKLANTLRRHGVSSPADLPREQVRKILDA